jgi:hypothetical protein
MTADHVIPNDIILRLEYEIHNLAPLPFSSPSLRVLP